MKIIAERAAILQALSFVSNYADASGRIPILSMVRFEATGASVVVTATDSDKAASDAFPSHTEREGGVCLPGALLVKAIRSTDATEVQIDVGDKGAVVQIGGRVRMKLPVLPVGDFPNMTMLTANGDCQFTIDGSVLERQKRQVAFAEGNGNADAWSLGTLWEWSNGLLHLCALDRVVMSRISVPAQVPSLPRITVPATELPSWEGDVSVCASENFIRFSCGKQSVATKLINVPFPDYQRIIPDHSSVLRFDRAELLAAVNRMSLLSIKGGAPVLIVGRDGMASLSAADMHDGREIADRVAYEGGGFQTALPQRSFSAAISSVAGEIVEIRIGDHTQNVTLHDPRDDSRIMLIAPYRDPRLAEFLPKQEAAA